MKSLAILLISCVAASPVTTTTTTFHTPVLTPPVVVTSPYYYTSPYNVNIVSPYHYPVPLIHPHVVAPVYSHGYIPMWYDKKGDKAKDAPNGAAVMKPGEI